METALIVIAIYLLLLSFEKTDHDRMREAEKLPRFKLPFQAIEITTVNYDSEKIYFKMQ